jgi:hypothetical protein
MYYYGITMVSCSHCCFKRSWKTNCSAFNTALVAGWAGSMALYELAVYDPSDPVLNQCGVKVCSLCLMTHLGITDSWGGWVSLKVSQTLGFGVLKV